MQQRKFGLPVTATGCTRHTIMCKRLVNSDQRHFILFYLLYFYLNTFYFIGNHEKQRKMLIKLNVHCYSYQVKKQLYRMNGLTDLSVIDSEKRCEWSPSAAFVS